MKQRLSTFIAGMFMLASPQLHAAYAAVTEVKDDNGGWRLQAEEVSQASNCSRDVRTLLLGMDNVMQNADVEFLTALYADDAKIIQSQFMPEELNAGQSDAVMKQPPKPLITEFGVEVLGQSIKANRKNYIEYHYDRREGKCINTDKYIKYSGTVIERMGIDELERAGLALVALNDVNYLINKETMKIEKEQTVIHFGYSERSGQKRYKQCWSDTPSLLGAIVSAHEHGRSRDDLARKVNSMKTGKQLKNHIFSLLDQYYMVEGLSERGHLYYAIADCIYTTDHPEANTDYQITRNRVPAINKCMENGVTEAMECITDLF